MKLIIFAGPSGTGKTTIVRELLKENPELSFSISCTTRAMRAGEVHGRDYYFLSETEFRAKVAHDEFIEYEEVYSGTLYGTLKSEVERIWKKGQHVIFDIDVVGALNIKNLYREKAVAIVVMPPNIGVLRERLISRGSETVENLERRIGKAEKELAFAPQFDHQLVNDQLEDSIIVARNIVDEFIAKA